jgi:hypothetical protein
VPKNAKRKEGAKLRLGLPDTKMSDYSCDRKTSSLPRMGSVSHRLGIVQWRRKNGRGKSSLGENKTPHPPSHTARTRDGVNRKKPRHLETMEDPKKFFRVGEGIFYWDCL